MNTSDPVIDAEIILGIQLAVEPREDFIAWFYEKHGVPTGKIFVGLGTRWSAIIIGFPCQYV